MSELKPLNVSLQKFSADMFDKAAQGAYEAMCDQLNILLELYPQDEARLTLLHDQALQARDMIAHQGKLIAKVYELAQAQQQIAQTAQMGFAILEDAIINQDTNNPLVGRLIADIKEAVYTEYGADESFTDSVNELIARRMTSTIPGMSLQAAAKFIDIIGSTDKLLPEHIEEAFMELLNTWEADGLEVEEGNS